MVFYTDKFIPKRFAGYTIGPFIWIRPKYKDDIGLLTHEKTHAKQWYYTLGISSFLYLVSKKYRLWAEVQAYKAQFKCPPANVQNSYRVAYSKFISERYGLNVTSNEAYELLRGD